MLCSDCILLLVDTSKNNKIYSQWLMETPQLKRVIKSNWYITTLNFITISIVLFFLSESQILIQSSLLQILATYETGITINSYQCSAIIT